MAKRGNGVGISISCMSLLYDISELSFESIRVFLRSAISLLFHRLFVHVVVLSILIVIMRCLVVIISFMFMYNSLYNCLIYKI